MEQMSRSNYEPVEMDDLEVWLEEELQDPEFRDAYEDAEARAECIEQLVRLRRTNGLTQADVANRMGTTQSAVSDLESNGGDVFVSTLQRYARAVDSYVRTVVVVPGAKARGATGPCSWRNGSVSKMADGEYIRTNWTRFSAKARRGDDFLRSIAK